MKVQLTTAIYGGYERPKPLPSGLGIPAVMYTDNPDMDAPGWDVRYVPLEGITDGLRRAKWWKTQPLQAAPDADVSIWMDSSMNIQVPDYVHKCLMALGSDDLSFMQHPQRNCIFDEARFANTLPRYNGAGLLPQAEFYRQQGHPPHWGLMATGNMVIRHSTRVQTAFNDWWLENISRSGQDQISLSYILRKHEDSITWNTNVPWWLWWHYTEHGH